jgi:hypothetical protein
MFLIGDLIQNQDGHIHEDSVLDRLLTVRHSGRTTIEVYDPSWPISTTIHTGKNYEMILVATKFKVLMYPLSPFEGVKMGIWRGRITEVHWQAPTDEYPCARAGLYRKRGGERRSWTVLATQIGEVLVNPTEIKTIIGFNVEPGEILQWEAARFDLYAVKSNI